MSDVDDDADDDDGGAFVGWLTQISCDSGFKKLNTPGFCLIGFLIIIEMPSDINGLLKSMTRSRSAVMVIGAIAISAS